METQAQLTRDAGRILGRSSFETRKAILRLMAERLVSSSEQIMAANKVDLERSIDKLAPALYDRLKLTSEKLQSLSAGIAQLSAADNDDDDHKVVDPIGRCLRRTEVSEQLILEQITVPLGVLLIIFESRPDALPQIVSLAVLSGNGLLLKGGSEASNTNTLLHSIMQQCITDGSAGQVPVAAVTLVDTRQEIASLLRLDNLIDLVIPRGSSELVRTIQASTRIPVLGHAEGVCHVYVDKDCMLGKALGIVIDSKTQYPAACNAMETLILHRALVDDGSSAKLVLLDLKRLGVKCYGDASVPADWVQGPVESYHTEYSGMECSVVVVDSIDDAIAHIDQYGSGHTEVICTESTQTARYFTERVDAACVFHNASSRFADGYRFGLGCEVGISTGKIHARGPVGLDGLVTTKWLLKSVAIAGHTVKFTSRYTHRPLSTDGTTLEASLKTNQKSN